MPLKIEKVEDADPQDSELELNQRRLDLASPKRQSQELTSVRSELERFRTSAKAAEEEVAKLKAENIALQAAMDELRNEMQIAELKRQAREASFRKQEEILKASKVKCDAQILSLLSKNEALLQDAQRPRPSAPTSQRKSLEGREEVSISKTPRDKPPGAGTFGGRGHSTPDKHATKCGPDPSMADIWILEGQDSTLPLEKPRKNRASVEQPSQVLKEINQNPVWEDENRKPNRTTRSSASFTENISPSKPQPAYEFPRSSPLTSPGKLSASGTKKMHARRSTVSSPHTSKLKSAASPPGPISSSLHSVHQSTSSESQQKPKLSLRDLTQAKSTLTQASGMGTVAASTDTRGLGRKELEAPAPGGRKEAMRARMAERRAQRRKAREEKGEDAWVGLIRTSNELIFSGKT